VSNLLENGAQVNVRISEDPAGLVQRVEPENTPKPTLD
jgi:hypothetical protein